MKGRGKHKISTQSKVEIETEPLVTYINTDFQRKHMNEIKLKDLKDVQFQLDSALVCATKKKKQIEENICSLESICAKKIKRSKSTDSLEKKNTEERPPKKLKESNCRSHTTVATPQTKGKIVQVHHVESHLDIPKIQKNDGPSRFWAILEPYCAEITQDTVRAIEDWIRTQDNTEKYQTTPELGQHFSEKWPAEDIKEESKEGSKSVENNKGLFVNSSAENEEIRKIVSLGCSECTTDIEDEYNSLTNRMIFSLVRENLMTFLDDTMTESCNGNINNKSQSCFSQPLRQSEADSLEKRLLRDFHKIGLLELNENEPSETRDEVLHELKMLQSALIPVNEYNTALKKKLLVLAKAEMAKQELKKKLQELDAKVMEIYRIVSAARKNNSMNKKIEEQVKKILREKKKLVDKLKNMK